MFSVVVLLSLVESSRCKTCVRTYLHSLLICFNFVSVIFNKTVFCNTRLVIGRNNHSIKSVLNDERLFDVILANI